MCSDCARCSPVTDKWLSVGSHRPTLARCELRRYLVLYDGTCMERDPFTDRDMFKPKDKPKYKQI